MKKVLSIVLSVLFVCSCMMIPADAAEFKELDFAFVIDTTGSMWDNLNQVKENMREYVAELEESGKDFRVAIVDYRDFATRTGSSEDYPYNVVLDFTNSVDKIKAGIDSLYLGDGGDWEETVYSALIDGLDQLSWREKAGKAAILMGDAPALDPEPNTGYTKEMAVNKLRYDNVAYGEDVSASAEVSAAASTRTHVQLFTIAAISDYIGEYEEMMQEVIDNFEYLADKTGGEAFVAEELSDITDIITEIIDQIDEKIVEPDKPLEIEEDDDDDKKDDSIWSRIWKVLIAPFAFFYMIFAKMIDSSSATFNRFLEFLERIFKR